MNGEESLQESDLAALEAGMLIEQDTLIRTMKERREKLRKKQKRTTHMLAALRSIIPEVASRGETREEVSERELEETHHTLTASALKERQLLVEELLQQGIQVDQLMSIGTDQAAAGGSLREARGSFPYSETDHTPVHRTSLSQPTPEREANLEKYMMTHSRGMKRATPTSTAKQLLFRDDDVTIRRDTPLSERAEVRRERDEMKVNSILMEEGVEGLMSEVQREREKYASLLEERRLLEETQMRMTERALSPGPPPLPRTDLHPQYRRYRTPSDMDLVSLEGDPVTQIQTGVEYDWSGQEEFVPINPPVQSRPQMEEMVAQMWQYFQQQPRGHTAQHTPVYNSQPHHIPPPPPNTHHTEFPCYPPPTPTFPSVPFYHPTHVPMAHPFPVYSHSLPPAPSPLPYYQTLPPVQVGYPSPYYPSVPTHMYQSLPTPGPAYSENQFLHHQPYPPFSNLNQTLPPSFTQPPTPAPPVPQTASCTQTDLTFLDNPISSPPPPQTHASRRETRPAVGRRSAPIATSNILTSPPVIESPLFDQVREQIYSEVASLVSENESRPYYLMELLRAAQLLNTDYLRQTGLNSLKRVINNYLNPDQINPQAFSSFPAPPRPPLPGSLPPDTQLAQQEEEEGVYSPTQNFPLVRHYLNTDLSGSSENVDDRCVSRACQLSDAVHQLRTQMDRHGGFEMNVGSEDESDISEITTSDLSGCEIEPSPWEPRVRVLITRLIPILKQHLDESCEPRLLALIHYRIMSFLSELFPEEVVQGVYRSLDRDLKETLGSYTSQRLRDCGEELLVDVSDLFFSQVNFLAADSLQLSYESDGDEYFSTDRRDQARDDELASATLESLHDKDVTDRTFTLPDGDLYIQGHKCTEVDSPLRSSPILSPPQVNIINLTLSESRPLDENAVSEKSEDFSHSKTVDTVSETTSCTASDLSEMIPPQQEHLTSLPDATPNHVSLSQKDSSSSHSDELPPFAKTCLPQGSFTLLVPNSLQQDNSCSTSKSEFIAEVLSLTSPEKHAEGPSPILVPSLD